jgi:hypothetical protein
MISSAVFVATCQVWHFALTWAEFQYFSPPLARFQVDYRFQADAECQMAVCSGPETGILRPEVGSYE